MRKQIRDAVVATVTGLTTTGTRVFVSRKYALQVAETPCLLVYSMVEESSTATLHYPRILDRRLTIRVSGVVKQNATVDDTLDTIASEVETALAANYDLGGLVVDCQLVGTEMALQTINEEEVSDKPIGVLSMDWQVLYRTLETTPDVQAF